MTEKKQVDEATRSLLVMALEHIGEAIKCIGMCADINKMEIITPDCIITPDGHKFVKENVAEKEKKKLEDIKTKLK